MADTRVTPPPFRNLHHILDRMRVRFGQTDARLENQLIPELTDRMREICSEYPYWFLTVEPGSNILADFPFTSPATPGYHDIGWFITTAGVDSYPIEAAIDLTEDQTLVAACEAREIKFVKLYDLTGAFLTDLAVQTASDYYSQATTLGVAGSGVAQGSPLRALPHTVQGTSYIRLNPVPDSQYVICMSWDLAYPPWFQAGAYVTNLILQHYPRLLECLVGIQYAEFFKEWEMRAFFEKEIWGDAQGKIAASIPNSGIIGRMKNDTIRRFSQDNQELEWHQSARDAVGRSGGRGRNPGDTYYTGPGNYL